MARIGAAVDRAARTRLPVLILGETGAGKERLARRIHAASPRHARPFVAFNCAALAESLLEAELFGAVRGAFTGADRDRRGLFSLADGGTLMLDELGDMPLVMQAKLLRALDEGRVRPVGAERELAVDVRLVAATHRDLALRVRQGRFRADLYHRLAVIQIRVPPLRRRLAELGELVRELTPRLEREIGRKIPALDAGALAALRTHDWPGNVRELHAVLARAVLDGGGAVDADAVRRALRRAPRAVPPPDAGSERAMIAAALDGADGSITEAARRIGWTRQKLYRRIKALAVDRSA